MSLPIPLYLSPIFLDHSSSLELLQLTALKGTSFVEVLASGQIDAHALFEQYIRPVQRLNATQARLTGLTNRKLEEAPDLDEAFQGLLEYADGTDLWVVPAGERFRAHLNSIARQVGMPLGLEIDVLGIDELAAVVLPVIARGSPFDLVRYYKSVTLLDEPDQATTDAVNLRENALSPTQLMQLWGLLWKDLLKIPLPVLAEMNWLLAKVEHPLARILKLAEREAVSENFSEAFNAGKLSLSDLFQDFSSIVRRLGPGKGEEGHGDDPLEDRTIPIEPGQVASQLAQNGPMSRQLSNYEERPEQIALARQIAQALSEGKHLLAEAGTGVGKSLAYLTPVVLFAMANRRPIVVSTHTKNLQSQLFEKDIPLLQRTLGLEFKAALAKGRANYLCVHKLLYTLQESNHELDTQEKLALLPVMHWAIRSEDGDIAELNAFSKERNAALWDRLHTVGEDCLGRQCAFYEKCFVYRARGISREADVVVANHSLVFAELGNENSSLPPYLEIVFDEAHTMEDVATDHLSCEVTPLRIYRILNKLYRAPRPESGGKGLLPTLLHQLDQVRQEFAEERFSAIRDRIMECMQAIEPANQGNEYFFERMRSWNESQQLERNIDEQPLTPFVPQERTRQESDRPRSDYRNQRASREERIRFRAPQLNATDQELFREAKETIIAGLGRLRQALERTLDDFVEIRKTNMARARELHKELAAQQVFLQELIGDIEFIVKGDEANYVYWTEQFGKSAMRLTAAPLELGPILQGQLFERKRAVILTSATLSVRDAAADAGSGFSRVPMLENRTSLRPASLAPPETLTQPTDKPHPKSFEFLKQRLGLSLCEAGSVEEILEGSPFDYARQCRLYIPAFLPEPMGAKLRDANEALHETIAALTTICRGRAMALYTSHAALTAGAAYLRKALAPEGIEVLAQGMDGSREQLLAKLKQGGSIGNGAILLGTSSFWEGVDVQGDALSLLIITKLPFAVFTDPLIRGRCELLEARGKDPFLHFSVPNAILKLRQGFGRLIRSKKDRGIAILADKRVLTKRYGPAFLRALPIVHRQSNNLDELLNEVKSFMSEDGAS